MNRIQLWADSKERLHRSEGACDSADSVFSLSPEVPHQFFAPLHYEPNYAYPLLVWLHSAGGNERELLRVLPKISTRNYVGVGPGGTRTAAGGRGFDWDEREAHLARVEHQVFESVEAAERRFCVNRARIFLAGFGSGGVTALRLGLRYPQQFAGVISLGGPFPLGESPLRELNAIRTLPLWIAQGRDSAAYPLERTCEELRLFHAAGMSVTVRQYPCGDELDSLMLADLNHWIMERITGMAGAATPGKVFEIGGN